MPLEPWMAQIGLGSIVGILLMILGRSYINHVNTQVADLTQRFERQLQALREDHTNEIARLTATWESRLADANRRGDSWETAAMRYEAAGREDRSQVGKLLQVTETQIALLGAIRKEVGG